MPVRQESGKSGSQCCIEAIGHSEYFVEEYRPCHVRDGAQYL
jgi:hypothetical protein